MKISGTNRWNWFPWIAALLLVARAGAGASPESAEAVIHEQEAAKVAALRAYLEEHPEAPDRDLALAEMANSLRTIGETEALIEVMEQRYAMVDKSSDDPTVIGPWLQEVVAPLVELRVGEGDRDGAEALLDRIVADTEDNPMAAELVQYVDFMRAQLNRPVVGDRMEMKFTAVDGREVDLAAMEDRVVLVDFWATWCQPCLAEMPNVLAAYREYHDDGFEVIGVSLDQSEEDLKEYVEKEKIAWPQHHSGPENKFAERYAIDSIPATFLIGKDGRVVATDLRGSELAEKLAELFAEE